MVQVPFKFYMLRDGKPEAVDAQTWAEWFENSIGERIVRQTYLNKIFVSTVFLGLDHRYYGDGPPILWETMVFGGKSDGAMWRYSNVEAAARHHEEILKAIRKRFLKKRLHPLDQAALGVYGERT